MMLLLQAPPSAAQGKGPAGRPARAIPLPMDREAWYAIRWDNQLVGYSHYSVERKVALAGEEFYIVNSDARLKLGAGEANDVSFRSKLMLNQGNLQPSFFFCKQAQGGRVLEVECLFTDSLVAQKTRVGKEETSSTINPAVPPYLLFNNIWGRLDTFAEHYAIMLAAWEATGSPKEMPVYEPVLRGTGSVGIQASKRGTVKVGTRDVPARLFVFTDLRGQPLVNAWVSEKGTQVLRLEDLQGGFTFSLSDRKVEDMVKSAPPVDLYRNRIQFSNVYFPNSESMRTLRADIDVRLHGNPVPQRQVKGYNEKFVGTSESGHVQGSVTVATAIVVVRKTDAFPRQTPVAPELEPFLAADSGIEANQDVMKSKGEEVTWRSRNSWEAARKVNTWVHDHMKEGYSMPSARYVLDHGAANSEGRALLAVALLRSVKVPARVVGGIIFAQGNFVPHYWAEVHVGGDGWVPMDPTTGEAGTLGATHVALWEHGDLMSMDVKVLDYGPRPPARVTFFNRELAWPVGQQRVYSVQNGGKEIGRETARVVGLTKRNGKDVYQLEFSTDVTIGGRRNRMEARLLTDLNVLPASYTTTQTQGDGPAETRTVEFGGNVARETFQVDGKERVQETPVSEGVYVGDTGIMSLWALIVGQYPNPRKGEAITIHVYRPDLHKTDDVLLTITQEEKLSVAGEERDTWRCETSDGVSFYIDKQTSQVVRIEQPRQDLVLQLIESTIKL